MRHLPLFAAIALLSACAQDGPEQLAASEVTGVASDSYIIDGNVRVLPIGGGRTISATRTDQQGNYHITDFRAPAGHYKIIVEGGYYIEESSGQKVMLDAGEQLSALFYHEPGTPVSTMITPETSLATGLALCLADRDRLLMSNAARNAGSQLSSMFDVSVNTTRPSNITDPDSASTVLTSSLKYAFIQAGRSEMVQRINEDNGLSGHERYTSMDFSMLSYRDIRDDCQLDGNERVNGSPVPLSMGVVEIGTNTYRTSLSQGMLRAASSSYNKTTLDVDNLLLLANQISTNTEAVYGGEPYQGVDAEGPSVIWEALENQVLNGRETIRVKATDPVGMGESLFYIGGVLVGSKEESGWMEWDVDTRAFNEGPQVLELVAYDSIGNRTIKSRNLVFDNSGPDIDVISTLYSSSTIYRLEGTIEDEFSPLASFRVQGQEVAVDNGNWHKYITLGADTTNLSIVAVDASGEQSSMTVEVKYDPLPPSTTVRYSTAKFRNPDTTNVTFRTLNHPAADGEQLVIGRDTLSLDTVALNETSLDSAGIPYIAVDVEDQASTNATPPEALSATYRVTLEGVTQVAEGQIPFNDGSYFLPLTIEYLTEGILMAQGDDTLSATLTFSDKAGNEVSVSYQSLVYLDLSKILLQAPRLNANTIIANRYSSGASGMLNQCVVVSGTCQVAFPNSDEDVLFYAENTRYEEPYNGRVLSTILPMKGLVRYRGSSIEIAYSPLSLILTGYFEAESQSTSNFDEAFANAKTRFINRFGFDPVETIPQTPSGQAELTDGLKLYFLLEALSAAAYDRNGYFDSDVNSIAMVHAGYLDISDNVADGRNDGTPVAINSVAFSYNQLLTETGKRLVDIAWIKAPDLKASVAEFAMDFYTPIAPAIDFDPPTTPVQGQLRIDPSFSGEPNQTRTLLVNGQYYGSGNAWTIDTTSLPNGTMSFEIRVEDRYAQTATRSFTLTIDNEGPEVSVLTNIFTTNFSKDILFGVSDAYSDPVSLEVNNEFYLLTNGKSFVNTNTVPSVRYLDVIGLDGLGNMTQRIIPIIRFPSSVQTYSGVEQLIDASDSDYEFTALINGIYLNNSGGTGQLVVDVSSIAPGNYSMTVSGTSATGEISSIEVPVQIQ